MLLPLFERLEASAIGEAVRGSLWLFPIVEAFHLIGLAVIGGAILVVDFRLLGLTLRSHSVSRLAHDMQPWVVSSLVLMIVSGIPLFLSEAIKCYYSFAFWTKMTALLGAVLFTFTLRRVVAGAPEGRYSPTWNRAVALTSIALWSTVGWGGRWIGFSG
ncbi:MAG: hypothetical protein HYU37_15365 [Acidobacteria bacterium]|nr:hypothetical protein [Acidobacteriota bacterium]